MTGLEQTFYIMAIVYMGLMFLFMVIGLVAVLAIRAKLNAIHRQIEERLHTITSIAHVGEELIGKAKKAFRGDK